MAYSNAVKPKESVALASREVPLSPVDSYSAPASLSLVGTPTVESAALLSSPPSTPVALALIAERVCGGVRCSYLSAVISLPRFLPLFEESEPVLRGSAHPRSACL